MITTTLNRIRAHSPCSDGWTKLLKGLGKAVADDEPLPYSRIAEINGLYDSLWCCRAEPQEWKTWRLFAVWCGRQGQHLMTDPRSLAALDVAERHARGEATDAELAAAWGAAREAAGEAAREAAWKAAGEAALAAAREASFGAAGEAVWKAAGAAALAAAREAALAAAGEAAWKAAFGAALDAQLKQFIKMVNEAKP